MARGSQNLPYVFIGGVMLVAILAIFVYFVPQYRAIVAAGEEVAAVEATRVEREAFLEGIDRKSAELAAQAVQERELDLVLPNNGDIDDVLRIIERAAITTGVVVEKVENNSSGLQSSERAAQARGATDELLPAGVLPLGVAISARGSYQQLRQFTDALSSSIRLMDVQTVSIAVTVGQLPDTLGANLDVQFYRISDTE